MDSSSSIESTRLNDVDEEDHADQEMVDVNGLEGEVGVRDSDEFDDSSSSDDSDDENSDDDGDDDDDDDYDEEEFIDVIHLEGIVADTQQQLASNPYYYEGHIQLIGSLKKLKDAERLKKAREAMSSLFPLSEDLWIDWLNDEDDDEEKQRLLERAIDDYDSFKVWSVYVYHTMPLNDPSRIRDKYERAVSRLGLHPTKGSQIWDDYRRYERRLLAAIVPLELKRNLSDPDFDYWSQKCIDSDSDSDSGSELCLPLKPMSPSVSEEDRRSVEEQTERMTKLFVRQLSCPLIDNDKTYEEYVEWIGEVDPQVVRKFEDSLEKVKDIRPFEEKLMESNDVDNYFSYIDHLVEKSEPNCITCLFERAVKDHPIRSDLWIKYTKYTEKNLRIKDVVLRTYRRSVRNCPWCLDLWLGHMRAMERFGVEHENIRGAFNDSLSVGFSEAPQYLALWTAYIDYLRRRIDWTSEDHSSELETLREAFANATNQLYQTFSNDGDPTCSLLNYQAFIEAKYCKDITRAREIYSSIMQRRGLANQATPWLQYAQLERSFGDVKHCRKVFQKALNSVTDWPEYVTEAYIRFEREEGDLEKYTEAVEKCEAQLKRIEERRAKEAEKQPKEKNRGKMQKKSDENIRDGKKKNFKERFEGKKEKGRKREPGAEEMEIKPYVSKRSKVFMRSDKQEENQPIVDSDGFKVPAPPRPVAAVAGSSGPPPSSKRKRADDDEEEEEGKRRHGAANPESSKKFKGSHSERNEMCTVFVSNLLYSVTEETMWGVFSAVGEVKDVSLVSDHKGNTRGFGYVEFVEELSAMEALKMDRREVGGRPMFVSKYNKGDRSRESKLKFGVGLEKNKLFIKNLNFETTQDDLEKLFGTAGKLKGVRIAQFKNGKPKGWAYVDYESEECAARAVLQFNGCEVDGHRISVELSNPPARGGQKSAPEADGSASEFLGAGRRRNPTGARMQLPMMPRSLSLHQKPAH